MLLTSCEPNNARCCWPETNFSEMKSAMIGRVSRAVAVGVWDASLRRGFSLLAAPSPQRGIATQPYDRAELVLRLVAQDGDKRNASATPQYFAAEACSICGDSSRSGRWDSNCSAVVPEARCGASRRPVCYYYCYYYYYWTEDNLKERSDMHRRVGVNLRTTPVGWRWFHSWCDKTGAWCVAGGTRSI